MHLGTKMNRLDFGVKRSKVKVTLSQWSHPALDTAVEFRCLVLNVCVHLLSFQVLTLQSS